MSLVGDNYIINKSLSGLNNVYSDTVNSAVIICTDLSLSMLECTNASVSGNVTIGGTLSTNTISNSGSLYSSSLLTSSNASISGGLTVNNGANISNGATIVGGLFISGGTSISGGLYVSNGAFISGGASISGGVSIGGNIYINNTGTNLKISPGYKASSLLSNYCTYDLQATGVHYFWDDVEVTGVITEIVL
jgi:hypothetical protein